MTEHKPILEVPHKKSHFVLSDVAAKLIEEFWIAPMSAFFSQKTIACVRCVSEATLENERWRKSGIPYRKVSGRVLYRKSDVVSFLEKHVLVCSTSEYGEGVTCQK